MICPYCYKETTGNVDPKYIMDNFGGSLFNGLCEQHFISLECHECGKEWFVSFKESAMTTNFKFVTWYPIERAPKDKTRVILFCDGEDMRFFPKEICEKLVKLGCVSASGFIHDPTAHDLVRPSQQIMWPDNKYLIRAFWLCDFLDTTEQAKDNCKKLSFDKHGNQRIGDNGYGLAIPFWQQLREDCLKSNDAIKFISEHVERL